MRKSIFVDSYLFTYFHWFGEEPFTLQESVCERIHLVTINLLKLTIIYQDNFEYLAEINVLVSIIIKISKECNFDQWKSNPQYPWKYFSGKRFNIREIDNTRYIKTLFWITAFKEQQIVFPRAISNSQRTFIR